MSEGSFDNLRITIYEETLNKENLCDCSSQGLEIVPKLESSLLSVIYLQNNKLITLPDDFFPTLPSLKYLDLRDNLLTDIPKTVKNHETLTHLLLQNNKLTSLPNELGTVANLKVLQLNGNPLMFPPREIINAGVSKLKTFLNEKKSENLFVRPTSALSEDTRSNNEENVSYNDVVSYNSVTDAEKMNRNDLIIQLNEKNTEDSTDDEYHGRLSRKCPKLAKSRHKTLPSHLQSNKYVRPVPVYADSKEVQNLKIKQAYLKDLAIKKHKELSATREKILQERKNLELLRTWRTDYRSLQRAADKNYRLNQFPYDTSPDYMTLLSRDDIEKDLPDKYRKNLVRKCKPRLPRKGNNDTHLAMKIKQLFENLEAIDLNREGMTPRTEQKVLRNEIQKISEIKQKLRELSTTNTRSLAAD